MRKLLLFGVMVVLLAAQVVLAKGPPQKITISGPGLLAEISITQDEPTLNGLAMMSLEDYDTLTAEAPTGIGEEGYLLTRFYEQSPGRYIPFDRVEYFPNPAGEDERGYLLYVGIVGGSSEYDGKWYRPTAEGEALFQAVLSGGRAHQQEIARATVWNTFLDVAAIFRR
jgi:hypothetical protein